jgi:hypothetical protein
MDADILQSVLDRLVSLEKRLEALEARGRAVPDQLCPRCRVVGFRLTERRPIARGLVDETWICQECGTKELRVVRGS